MNDPSTTTAYDEDLLHDLEAEYMVMAQIGDPHAFDFAVGHSDEFCRVSGSILMRLMEKVPVAGDVDMETVVMVVAVAMAGREHLEKAFKEVAPQWAAQEYPKRVAAAVEMTEEWQGGR